ncbi:MAG TPA: cytochrome [Acidobacteriota bacterium]|jgi:hypothetical protein
MAQMRKFIVGVMGAGEDAHECDVRNARKLGELIAREGWVVLSGARDAGVMGAVNEGAKSVESCITVGIVPSKESKVSSFVDIVVMTDMNEARNNINVLSSDIVVACGVGGAGTVSEIALALKADKNVILLGGDNLSRTFFERLRPDRISFAETAEEVVNIIRRCHLRKS